MATLQWARAAGMKVIATGGSDQGLALATAHGAHHLLNHNEPDYMDEIPELTVGRGVDVIVELAANINLGNDLRFLAPGGRVVIVGGRGRVEIDPGDAIKRDATIVAMSLFNASEHELAGIHDAIGAGLENGFIRPVCSMELPLDEAAQAHESILAPGALGKIVLIPLKDR
jgi:NADPH:quinone reductase